MERHRSAASRARRRTPAKPRLGFREKLVLQFIVCGFIVALAMVSSLVKLDFIEEGMGEFKKLIQLNPSFEDFTVGISDSISAIGGSVKTIFGFEPEPTDALPVFNLLPHETEADSQTYSKDVDDNEDFRIDEDILNEILNKEDFYNKY